MLANPPLEGMESGVFHACQRFDPTFAWMVSRQDFREAFGVTKILLDVDASKHLESVRNLSCRSRDGITKGNGERRVLNALTQLLGRN